MEKPVKHHACEDDYAWNLNPGVWKCVWDFEVSKYLKDCEYMEGLVNEIVDTPESEPIISSDGTIYWLMTVDLLSTRLYYFGGHCFYVLYVPWTNNSKLIVISV